MLLHENLLFSLLPPHAGMRQYWRDFESLERWVPLGEVRTNPAQLRQSRSPGWPLLPLATARPCFPIARPVAWEQRFGLRRFGCHGRPPVR
jgi:hypothetical protein